MANLGLSGIASGVDTASIVEQLMSLERQGQTRLQMRKSSISAQQTTLRDLKTKLDAIKSAAAELRSATTWSETQTVESSDPARVAVARTGGAPIGGYTVKVTQLASSAQKTYTWTESGSATTLDFGGGKTLDVAPNAKIADVASAINGRGDLPVYAAVVGGDKLVLSSRATGASADFTVTGAQLSAPTATVAGRDALYELNGVAAPPSATNVVADAIPGVTLTFKGTTSEAASVVVGAPAVDKQKVKDRVKAFVDAYNALITATRTKLTEKSVPDAATQSDFNKGAFFGDSGLNSMLSKLRATASADFDGAVGSGLDTLREIGVSTGKAGSTSADSKAGLLQIDDAALTAALDSDVQAVRRLFSGPDTKAAEAFEQLADDLGDLLDGRIESVGTQSRRISDQMTRMDSRLEAKEKRLKAQFAAMESALNASNTQMAWLQGQLAGLPTWE
jgi:flagellar hook-associated protein 2